MRKERENTTKENRKEKRERRGVFVPHTNVILVPGKMPSTADTSSR
jgi:hypothetical protein